MLFGGREVGYEVVEGIRADALECFIVISSKGRPRLFLPIQSPAMRTAASSFLSARVAFALPLISKLCSFISRPFSKYCSHASVVSSSANTSPLRGLLEEVLKRKDFQIALRVSFGRPNAKTVVMAISNSGEALGYVKLGSEAMTEDLVSHEGTVLKQLQARAMPLIVPEVLYSGTWLGGQSVLVTKPLELEPLRKEADCAHLAANQLASLEVVEKTELANSVYWGRIKDLLTSLDNSHELLKITAAIEEKWGQFVFDFGMAHGDWTRANLGLVGGEVAALDWERCTNNAPKGLDIAHFAIAENISKGWNQSIDATQVAHTLKAYLKTVNLPEQHAKPLTLLASLEMVIRFKSAANVGLPSIDTKFGQALHFGVQAWAHE